MNVKTVMVAASVLVAAWTSASAQTQPSGPSVKDILNRAQTQSERKAVEDLIGKLKTNQPAAAPQAAPNAPIAPAAPAAAEAAPVAPQAPPVANVPQAPPPGQPATATAPVLAAPTAAPETTSTQQPTAATVDAPGQPAAAPIGGAAAGVAIGPAPAAADPQQPAPAAVEAAPTRVSAPPGGRAPGRRSAPSDTARVGAPIGPAAAVPTPIAPSEAEMARAPEIAKEMGLPTVDIEVLFAYDSAEIAPPAAESLMTLGRALADPRLAGQKFVIGGHTDAKGTASYNLALSDRRAQAVRGFLIEHFKIAPDDLIARGYGETRLKNPRNPLGAENRRVQVINFSAQLVQGRRR